MQVWCGSAWNEPYPVLSPCRNPYLRCRWLNAPCANHRDMNTGQPLTIREAVSEHVFRLMDLTNAELLLKVGALWGVGGVGGVAGVAGVCRCCCPCTCCYCMCMLFHLSMLLIHAHKSHPYPSPCPSACRAAASSYEL